MDQDSEQSDSLPPRTVAEVVASAVLNEQVVSHMVDLCENPTDPASTRKRRPAWLILESTHTGLLGQTKEGYARLLKIFPVIPVHPECETEVREQYTLISDLGKEFAAHLVEYKDSLHRAGSVSKIEDLEEQVLQVQRGITKIYHDLDIQSMERSRLAHHPRSKASFRTSGRSSRTDRTTSTERHWLEIRSQVAKRQAGAAFQEQADQIERDTQEAQLPAQSSNAGTANKTQEDKRTEGDG